MCCEELELTEGQNETLDILDSKDEQLVIEEGIYYGGGTNDYEKLKNLPQINDVTLIKNKTSKQLKLQDEMDTLSNIEMDRILGGI